MMKKTKKIKWTWNMKNTKNTKWKMTNAKMISKRNNMKRTHSKIMITMMMMTLTISRSNQSNSEHCYCNMKEL